MTIGEVILVSRKARGWSRRVLATHSGVPEMTISYIERGETSNPGILTCYRIGQAFGTGLSLFEGVEELEETEKQKKTK